MARIEVLTARHLRSAAECHIRCWREAYRGLVPDHILDAFDVDERTASWQRILDSRGDKTTHVALEDDVVVGFAGAGPARTESPTELELYAIYVRSQYYGTGIGDQLIDAAIANSPCVVWVFAENPRAQAFYRKHGFVADGEGMLEPFTLVPEIRMVRLS